MPCHDETRSVFLDDRSETWIAAKAIELLVVGQERQVAVAIAKTGSDSRTIIGRHKMPLTLVVQMGERGAGSSGY